MFIRILKFYQDGGTGGYDTPAIIFDLAAGYMDPPALVSWGRHPGNKHLTVISDSVGEDVT